MFTPLQLHTVLEKLFKKSRRRVLLKRTFREWANHTKNALFESWALEATEKLKCKQFLRKHFMRWKSTITFLGWNCIRVLQLEGMAKNFHCRTIFRAWFLVSMERKAQLIKLSKLVPIVTTTQRVLCYWRELCQQRWRHRGKLMKRFFRRMLEMIRAREESAIARRHAVALWTGLQKKIALRHWREFTRKQLHYCHFPPDRKVFTVSSPFDGDQNSRSLRFDSMNEPFSPSGWDRTSINLWGETLDLNYQSSKRFVNTDAVETNRLSLYMRYNRNISMQIFRRKKRTALLQLRYNIMIQRRQQLCVAAGMRHFITRVLEVNFNIWKAHIEADIFFRKKNAHRVLLMTLSAWKRFVKEEKIERAKLEAIESLASKAERKRQSAYLMRWHAAVRREKQVRRLTDFHREKSSRAITVRAFRCWLSRWASKVYWKYREALCECEKVLALREIDMEQRKAAEFEQKELASKCDRLVKSLHENELLLEEKRREKNDQDQRILDAEDKRQALLVQLETLAKELKDAQRERDQVRAFEHVIIEEVTSLENEMQRRQREAEDQMVAMQKESAALREEVEEARSQSYFSERFSTYETQRNENEYNMAVDKAALSQAELHLRREELAHLANEQSVIMQELVRVQQKLVDANRDGSVLTSENESILRKKTSKLGVLRSETGRFTA